MCTSELHILKFLPEKKPFNAFKIALDMTVFHEWGSLNTLN